MGGTIGGTIGKHLSGPVRTNGFGAAFFVEMVGLLVSLDSCNSIYLWACG